MNGGKGGLLGIAGTGLIGGSIGLRASGQGWSVAGWDASERALATAHTRGAVARTYGSFEELAAATDTLVIATPLAATLELIGRLRRLPRAPSLVIDVATLKLPVIECAAGLPGFAGTHPIAGSERAGPEHADADLFQGRAWAFVPPPQIELAHKVRALIAAMGARPFAVDARRHDETVAFTSGLPQLLAVVLAQTLGERLDDGLTPSLSGSGIRSMTRLGSSPWSMWSSLFEHSGERLAQELRTFADVLAQTATELESHSPDPLRARFGAAGLAAAQLRANEPGVARVSHAGRSDSPPSQAHPTSEDP